MLGRTDNPGRQAVLDGLTAELKKRDGVVVLGSLGFENAYAFAMRPDRATALGVASLADLAREAPKLTLGSDLEFLSRPEWKAVDADYGFRFKATRSFQPTFMYRALAGGDADVISAFSSDGRIAADHLVLLTDPKAAIPPYDAVVLISPNAGTGGWSSRPWWNNHRGPYGRRTALIATRQGDPGLEARPWPGCAH